MEEKAVYYIYDPQTERCYSYTRYSGSKKTPMFASDVDAHEFSSPKNAIKTLNSFPYQNRHLQVIDEYGDVIFDTKSDRPRKERFSYGPA